MFNPIVCPGANVSIFSLFFYQIATYAGQVASAPLGVVVVTSEGRRIVIPVADDETDPKGIDLRPFRFAPEFVRPHGEMPKGEFSAWMTPGIQMPPQGDANIEVNVEIVEENGPATVGEHPHPHPPPARILSHHIGTFNPGHGGCVKQGKGHKFKKMMAHRMHHLMNKFRAALGLPLIEYHHNHHHDGGMMRHRLRPSKESAIKVASDEKQSFFIRFEHAMRSLRYVCAFGERKVTDLCSVSSF